MESPIVTLTTDWGYRDYFAGMVKGRLYSTIPNVRVVDITHGLEPFLLARSIHVVRYACMGFPAGTVHIIDTTAPHNDSNPFIVVEHNSQYYICMDNGLPCAVFGGDASRAVIVAAEAYAATDSHTFAAYDIYCPLAEILARGGRLEDIGSPLEKFCPYTPNLPVYAKDKDHLPQYGKDALKLSVAYIDDYGNATLNITYKEFERIRAERPFEMLIRENSLTEVVPNYSFAKKAGNGRGALLLTVSATGHLQLAMRLYSAQQYFGLREQDSITVLFPTIQPPITP